MYAIGSQIGSTQLLETRQELNNNEETFILTSVARAPRRQRPDQPTANWMCTNKRTQKDAH
jgi:hypothetical protein